jgi:signal transduction histidine kinase
LAAGIAHEINTPIQFIGDNSRFLQDAFHSLHELIGSYEAVLKSVEEGAGDTSLANEVRTLANAIEIDYLRAEIPKCIKESLEGIERVAKILQALKDFSHPGSSTKERTNINQAIESTLTVARNEWKYVADVILDLEPDLPLVCCLAGAVKQVILNLIVNAAHAISDAGGGDSGGKGKISISTRCENDMVSIRIADTGGGIPAVIRSRIFDPFFTTKPVGKGTGQGLAIAYSVVVKQHGGTISFESEVGRGTTFIVSFPIHDLLQESECGVRELESCSLEHEKVH